MRILCFEDRSAPFIDVFRRTATAAGYDLLLAPPADGDPAFDRFRSLYRHLSVNPEGFELACFRRYFAAAALTGPDERVIMADSDLLVQRGPRDLPAPLLAFQHGLVGSVGVTDGVAETDISPHFSFWTRPLLRDFCQFLIETYRSRFDRLLAVHAARARVAARVAISDMTLLHLWIEDGGAAFLNSNRVFDGVHVDHNISMPACVDRRFRTRLGRKAVRFARGRLTFVDQRGEAVDAAVLHLQGRYKLAAPALAARRRGELLAIDAYIGGGRLARRLIAG